MHPKNRVKTEQKFQFYPDGNFYSVEELEAKIQFRYLPHIAFETKEAHQEIHQRGLRHKPNKLALELGKKYIKMIKAAYIPDVSIHDLGEKIGYGLFAEEEIPEGVYVGEYTGIVRKNNKRYFSPMNNYCYEYPISDEIDRSHVIDATSGNLTRFINHSYKPNLKPIHIFYEGYYHLIFISLCLIKKGEQLSYNYGRQYWYVRETPSEL